MEAHATYYVVNSYSLEGTEKIALDFATQLQAGDVVALYGDLGAGKTVFVQGMARGLNISTKVTSPTFVLFRSYPIQIKGKNLTFNHLDLYRIVNGRSFDSLGIDEILENDSITVIEWADKIKDKLPRNRTDVRIEKINDTSRKITIERHR